MAEGEAQISRLLQDAHITGFTLDNARSYDFVRFTFSDIHGVARCRLIPRRHVDDVLENGTGIGALIFHMGPRCQIPFKLLKTVKEASRMSLNLNVIAQPNTLNKVAWSGVKGQRSVAEVMCEPVWSADEPDTTHCRYIARQQMQKLEDLGYKILSSFEMENMILDENTLKPIFENGDYFSNLVTFKNEVLLFDLQSKMQASGIDTSSISVEFTPGQFEFTVKPLFGIGAADAAFRFKEAMLEICMEHKVLATFMTKMDKDIWAAGFHLNHSLWKLDDQDAFFDADGENKMSDVARHWIGGLVKHGRALTALLCPTVNCYHRLHRPWTHTHSHWGMGDRIQTFRMKVAGPSSTYLENRLPSSSCNPYIALAATVAAGIDGIVNKIVPRPPPPPGTYPTAEDEELPHTLEEALQALEQDKVIVDALGADFVYLFAGLKRDIEIEALKDVNVREDNDEDYEKERKFYLKSM